MGTARRDDRPKKEDVKEGSFRLSLSLTHLPASLSGCDVAKAHSRSMMANFFFDLEENFFRCASAQIYTQKFFLFPSSLSPALCHHDFFSNHVLSRKSERSPLNSIRNAKLQLFVNIYLNPIVLEMLWMIKFKIKVHDGHVCSQSKVSWVSSEKFSATFQAFYSRQDELRLPVSFRLNIYAQDRMTFEICKLVGLWERKFGV